MTADDAKQTPSPLLRFSLFYLIAGALAIGVYYFLVDAELGGRLALTWGLIGIPLVMILWGRAKRDRSDVAALTYLSGLALLPVLMFFGILALINSSAVRDLFGKLF